MRSSSERRRTALPALAVGVYLLTAATIMIPIGALLGLIHDRWVDRSTNPGRAKRPGTVMATGLIVGESFCGVVRRDRRGKRKEEPLAFVPESFSSMSASGAYDRGSELDGGLWAT